MEFEYYANARWLHLPENLNLWLTYPDRFKFNTPIFGPTVTSLDQVLQGRKAEDLATLLQIWAYFGFLAITIGVRDPDDFVETKLGGGLRLSTKELLAAIARWADSTRTRLRSQHQSTTQAEYERLETIFGTLNSNFRNLPGLVHDAPITDPINRAANILNRVWIPVELLAETVGQAVWEVYAPYGARSVAGDHPLRLTPFYYRNCGMLVSDKLLDLGWCYGDATQLCRTAGITTCCYATTMRRDSSLSHATCSGGPCTVREIINGTYQPKHKRPSCECGPISISCEDTRHILEATESYPVVRMWVCKTPEAGRRFEVLSYAPGIDYIALSHVWSDGLGNDDANQLLECQFDLVNSLLHNFPHLTPSPDVLGDDSAGMWSPYFWLDTLCVPRGNGSANSRRIACSKMAASYENAHSVLVLDDELMHWEKSGRSDSEAFLRISVAGWNKRVWTLSEGVLAKRLIFKFSDTYYDSKDAEQRAIAEQTQGPERYSILSRQTYNALGLMRDMRNQETLLKLVNAWDHTQLRHTSHVGDEIIALAVLLKITPSKISDLYERENLVSRISLFLQQLETIPLSLIFGIGPRLRLPGFHWAPSSPTQGGRLAGVSPKLTAAVSQPPDTAGVRFTRPGIFLKGPWMTPEKTDWTDSKRPHTIYRNSSQPKLYCAVTMADGWYMPTRPGNPFPSGVTEASFRQDERDLHNTPLAIILLYQHKKLGILVSHVQSAANGELTCKYQRQVNVFWLNEMDRGYYGNPVKVESMEFGIENLPPDYEARTYKVVGEAQRWLLT